MQRLKVPSQPSLALNVVRMAQLPHDTVVCKGIEPFTLRLQTILIAHTWPTMAPHTTTLTWMLVLVLVDFDLDDFFTHQLLDDL